MMIHLRQILCCLLLFVCLPALCLAQDRSKPFSIKVIDEETGRGIPMVELRTTSQVRYYTDSNGFIAIDDLDLMGEPVFFHVSSPGYEHGLSYGWVGRGLVITPGGSAVFSMKRTNIAERLYRSTGPGIYLDSLMLGEKVPIKHPLSNTRVWGCDGVLTTLYKGKVFWAWGDTNRPHHVLGNYQVSCATSELPGKGGLDPEKGIDFTYYGDPHPESGFVKQMAIMPQRGTTWLTAFAPLKDETGRERLYAYYKKFAWDLGEYMGGLAVFNDDEQVFEMVAEFNPLTVLPYGNAIPLTVDGVDYFYFCEPMSNVRVRARVEDMSDISKFEGFTSLFPGSDLVNPRVEKTRDGPVIYGWKPGTPSAPPQDDKKFVAQGVYGKQYSWAQLRDRDSGVDVTPQHGSVTWNEHRQRWVAIISEMNGDSVLGEVWYSEADSPIGPWLWGVKVVTHNDYSFYMPVHHPWFDKKGGREIFFEGSYAFIFSSAVDKTPRYDYNQIMYKLDLDDPRAAVPVPIYQVDDGGLRYVDGGGVGEREPTKIPFFAIDRPVEGMVAIYENAVAGGDSRLSVGETESRADQKPAFFAWPADMKDPPKAVQPLYEFVNPKLGISRYSTDLDVGAGFARTEKPLCLVWPNPLVVKWDVEYGQMRSSQSPESSRVTKN